MNHYIQLLSFYFFSHCFFLLDLILSTFIYKDATHLSYLFYKTFPSLPHEKSSMLALSPFSRLNPVDDYTQSQYHQNLSYGKETIYLNSFLYLLQVLSSTRQTLLAEAGVAFSSSCAVVGNKAYAKVLFPVCNCYL